MRVGIVLYPGSNCAEDMKRYFESFHDTCFYIWHKCDNIDEFDFDLLVIPGGFAFGDRYYANATDTYTLNPGILAKESPVSKIIRDAAERKKVILGLYVMGSKFLFK